MQREEILAFIDKCEHIPPPYIFVGISPQLVNHDHRHYQRPRIEEKVKKFQKKIQTWGDESYVKFPPAVVFKREDETLWSLDSQHHCEAAMREGMALIPALVIDSKGIDWEIKIFDELQKWQQEKDR